MTAPAHTGAAPRGESAVGRFLRATEIDTRMAGMVGALLLIWLGFHLYGVVHDGSGIFITPRNLWNLLVQTSSIAVMTCGMVLVIVMRHIDLSVGSILGFTGIVMGVLQVYLLPNLLGLGHPAIWILTAAAGIGLGCLIGAFQGALIADLEIPAFIVTLGGLLVWRGAAWWVASGATVAPLDPSFLLMGGGLLGAVGASASWILAALACAGLVWALAGGRRKRQQFGFALRPMWAEWFLGALGCFTVLLTTYTVNSYYWPVNAARNYAQAHNIPVPDGGLQISSGFAIPVLMALAVGLCMTFLATRTRFGRYVFAIGGNPEAALLAGVNTRLITLQAFMLMGGLAGLSACIATARVAAATNALGTIDELYVIAAAVIGGTSLAGGIGTIYGAILGALVMQSLQSGMILVDVPSALQPMAVGVVLVFAVWVDTVYRKKAG